MDQLDSIKSPSEPPMAKSWAEFNFSRFPARWVLHLPDMNLRRLPALVVAVFLQVAPLARSVEPFVAGVLQPLAMVLRWMAGAGVVTGGMHALSGATGLISANPVRGTNNVSLTYRAQITSPSHGTAKSYTALGLPPGLRLGLTTGIVSGAPTNGGVFSVRLTGWENSNGSGNSYSTTVNFLISPTIITDTGQSSVAEGGSITLRSALANNSTDAYRWIRDGLEVARATNATLVLSPARLTDAGTYTLRVTSRDGTQSTISQPFSLAVTAGPKPPVITSLVPDQAVHADEAAALEVVATANGSPLVYQWRRAGISIPEATSARVVVSNLPPAETTPFDVVVTGNGLSTTSAVARVITTGPLRVSGQELNSGGFSLRFQGITNRTYRLERALDPASTTWSIVAETQGTGGETLLVDPVINNESQVHRVRVLP